MRWLSLFATLVILAGMSLGGCTEQDERGPVVLAPSSAQDAVEAIADAWEGAGHSRPVLSFSSTPSVVRHVEEGAPADVVISADAEWMDWLEGRGLIASGTRRDIVGNSLIFVWRDMHLVLPTRRASGEVSFGARRIAIADPESVPAGRYARQALVAAGAWESVADKVAPTENVRVALALVEQGEADLGIVYASDLGVTSDLLSEPLELPDGVIIRYPAALTSQSQHGDAEKFLAFLSGPEAREIFCESGFASLPEGEPC